jgi:hypothetical protein
MAEGQADEVVTQQTFMSPTYRNVPRQEREDNVSVFWGRVSARDATAYIQAARNVPAELTDRQRAKIGVRRLSTRKLETAGFVVVRRGGRRVRYPEHCKVVWPSEESPQREWPPDVQEAFDACFTGDEEGWEE